MVLCPKCGGNCWTRPPGTAGGYTKENCTLCFSAIERCSTGFVDARLAAEYRASHPRAYQVPDEEPTKVDCPACQHCPHCHGTHMVPAIRASQIRAAVTAQKP